MRFTKFGYLAALAAMALLPLAGCSGSAANNANISAGERGTAITVAGAVDVSEAAQKYAARTLAAVSASDPQAANTVRVINAQDGEILATGSIGSDGSFTGLSFNLPTAKTILVFVAKVSQGTFRSVVPIDLSSPPAIVGNNQITIQINQQSDSIASVVSSFLGLSGLLGDAGMTLNAANSDYITAAQLVVANGGQSLAYSGSGLNLVGKVNQSLLPALDANTLTGDDLNNIVLDGSITSVAIPGNFPIVSFQVVNKATGKGIRGLNSFGLTIAQLKPGVNGAPSEWLSYMVTDTTRPTTDKNFKVIDNGDGSYVAIFAKDIKGGTGGTVTYDNALTHRVAVQVRTAAAAALTVDGTSVSNFKNEKIMFYDFVPATPAVAPTEQRNITTTEACNECHTKLGVTTPHGGRGDVRYCLMCHTSQRANGRPVSTSAAGAFTGSTYVADGEVLGDMTPMIHKIHMGAELTKTGYSYAGLQFNNIHYPKQITNCRQCHTQKTGVAEQGDFWMSKPSRKSCGSCHDNINFATGANAKTGGAAHPIQADDSFCASCHGVSGPYPVEKYHRTENVTMNNPKVADGLTNFTYDINSVTVDGSNQAVIKFRILASTDGSTPAPVVFTGASPLLAGFTGSPSFLLAYYKATANQPAATSADYNNAGLKAAQPLTVSIANLADGTKGTLTGPDASGYYTGTVTAAASNFPAGATMRAVALQGYFTQVTPKVARHAISVQKAVTNDAVRRKVIDSAKCANCHEWFEGHGGNRVYEVQVCTMCHVPNLSSSGRGANAANIATTMSATEQALLTADGYTLSDPTTYPEETNNFKDMIHGIHAGMDRTNPLKFVRDRGSVVMYFDTATFKFPGVLKKCDMCHTSTGYTSIPAGAQVTTDETSDGTALTLANNVSAVSAARTTLPNTQDIVTTPFTASCVSCHDSVAAKAHMKQHGGQLRVPRSAAVPSGESCVVCHGPTGTASVSAAHRM